MRTNIKSMPGGRWFAQRMRQAVKQPTQLFIDQNGRIGRWTYGADVNIRVQPLNCHDEPWFNGRCVSSWTTWEQQPDGTFVGRWFDDDAGTKITGRCKS